MPAKILVTYATFTGSTTDVAEAIGQTLSEHGATVDVLPMEEVTDLNPYDAVVAGSPIHASMWLPEALEWARTHRDALKARPFAAFLTCMTLAMPYDSAREKVPEFMNTLRGVIKPDHEGYFAGTLHLRKIPYAGARWGFRISVWLGVWKQGDHREWDKIRAWAAEIAPSLMKTVNA